MRVHLTKEEPKAHAAEMRERCAIRRGKVEQRERAVGGPRGQLLGVVDGEGKCERVDVWRSRGEGGDGEVDVEGKRAVGTQVDAELERLQRGQEWEVQGNGGALVIDILAGRENTASARDRGDGQEDTYCQSKVRDIPAYLLYARVGGMIDQLGQLAYQVRGAEGGGGVFRA